MNIVRFPGSQTQLVHLNGANVLVLDVSFRDDVRIFCVWDRATNLLQPMVCDWAGQRLRNRYVHATMLLEDSDPNIFVGLCTTWHGSFLCLSPYFPDPWAASTYSDHDNSPLRPWLSWGPTANKRAAVHGLLCRCWYLSNNGTARVNALTEALIMIHHRAFFPLAFISRCARKWAKEWIPRGASSPCRCLPDDVSQALARIPNLDEHAYCASVGCLTLSHTSKRHRHS